MTGGLARAVLGRLAAAATLFMSVATLMFATLLALPGDAVSARLGAGATPETTAALRQQLRAGSARAQLHNGMRIRLHALTHGKQP